MNSYFPPAESFLRETLSRLEAIGFTIPVHWTIDHLCFRTATSAEYHRECRMWSDHAAAVTESEVNGRPISTFELRCPIAWRHWRVGLVEVPSPKAGQSPRTGFEHLEIVCDLPFQELAQHFPAGALDWSGSRKPLNPELEVDLGGCAVKFHHQSLASVINLEASRRAEEALRVSGLLEKLGEFHPLIVGDFPLGLVGAESGLDILLEAKNGFAALAAFLTRLYGKHEAFHLQRNREPGRESLLAGFRLEGLPFKLSAQPLPPVRQKEFLYFQLAERVLGLGGPGLKGTLLTMRKRGIETKPAFAQALGLQDDPFEGMPDLGKASEQQLLTLLGSAGFKDQMSTP